MDELIVYQTGPDSAGLAAGFTEYIGNLMQPGREDLGTVAVRRQLAGMKAILGEYREKKDDRAEFIVTISSSNEAISMDEVEVIGLSALRELLEKFEIKWLWARVGNVI